MKRPHGIREREKVGPGSLIFGDRNVVKTER